MNFQIRTATLAGSAHRRLGKNNQDSLMIDSVKLDGKSYLFGVVCDGCTGGEYSRTETGAHLMTTFITNEIPAILQLGLPLQDVPQALFTRCIGYLSAITAQTIVGDPLKRAVFVRDHMLCTVIAFIADEEQIIFFSAGDGVFVINDNFIKIDQDNKPSYLGYHLVDRAYLNVKGGVLPKSFSVQCYSLAEIDHFAICSDGMLQQAVDALWGIYEPDNLLAVQRKLKVLSLRTFDFSDDCTAIVVQKIQRAEITAEDASLSNGEVVQQEGGGNGQ